MNWPNVQIMNWRHPLSCAASYAAYDMALLYSGMREGASGNTSYLFLNPVEVITGDTWDAFPPTHPTADALPDWVGYLSYELSPASSDIFPCHTPLPALRFVRYTHMLRFEHTTETLTHYSRDGSPLPASSTLPETSAAVATLRSNFSRDSYETCIARTLENIQAGEFYQANITRKFYGDFQQEPNGFALFTALCAASPAPYSAYIRQGDSSILSASPECFLSLSPEGMITTRPIKGSARRGSSIAEDTAIQQSLLHSDKNHAENLMIVDLMRNDLASVSVPQSVTVTEQSRLYSYATIHHLVSTICAQKRPDASARDVVQACFPPGSMTGAPKRAAMQWCAQEERMARGVYSGAIGWLGGAGNLEFSVVIRTLLLQQNRFEFQVGGGIVADSTPTEEWEETLVKGRGICLALGISPDALAAL